MKVNTKDTDSRFEKNFATFPFNPQKNLWCQIDLFSFSIYSPPFKKADEVLAFCITKEFNSIWHVLQGAVSNFLILVQARICLNNFLHK